jgi:uncharacterized repeat protein (TIGR03803 family)
MPGAQDRVFVFGCGETVAWRHLTCHGRGRTLRPRDSPAPFRMPDFPVAPGTGTQITRKHIMRSSLCTAATAAAILAATGVNPALAKPKYSAAYSFAGGNDGGFPHGGVIADATGALYGTTSSDGAGHAGVVYKLTPPVSGKKGWTQTTLYTFTGGADGATPMAALLADSAGNLYGTTYAGGDANGDGVVFELSPPAQGQTAWTETVLHGFTNGHDGAEPAGALIADASGNLYGTTTEGGTGVVGTVFELSPPAHGHAAWTETILYDFTGNADGGEPFGAVLPGAGGSLFGTTAGYGAGNDGTIYQITPPKTGKGAWGLTVLHAFSGGADGEVPRAGLIADADGALYGTTAGFDNSQGTVFKLTQSGNNWTQDVLYRFTGAGFTGNGPWDAVSIDDAGALYGTTLAVGRSANGEIFKLTPPAAGKNKWALSVLHVFKGGAASQFPYSNVLIGAGGKLFGTSSGSAGESGFYPGNVWEIKQ